MHKEINDIINTCNGIDTKMQTANELIGAIKEQASTIQQNTDQANISEKTLLLRKPLASLFILNSNLDDLIVDFEKLYDELKKI